MDLQTAVSRALDGLTPLLPEQGQRNVASWLEGGERWLALEQALGHAADAGVEVPADLLDDLAASIAGSVAAGRMTRERTGRVLDHLQRLRAAA